MQKKWFAVLHKVHGRLLVTPHCQFLLLFVNMDGDNTSSPLAPCTIR